MKYSCTVLSVKDIKASTKFYEELFGLEVYQDYGINIAFNCGLALQQEFGWLVGIPEEGIVEKPQNMELCFEEENFDDFLVNLKKYKEIECLGEVKEHSWGQRTVRFFDLDGHLIEVGECMKMVVRRFLESGLSMEETSVKMDVPVEDLNKILVELR